MLLALSILCVFISTQFYVQSHQSQMKTKSNIRKINKELQIITEKQQFYNVHIGKLTLQLNDYVCTIRSNIIEDLDLHKLYHHEFDLQNVTKHLDKILTPLMKKNAPK